MGELEKNAFVMVSICPEYMGRIRDVKEALAGLGSEYFRIGACDSVYGVYDLVVEVLSDGVPGSNLAVDRIRQVELDGELPVKTTMTMHIIDKESSIYNP